MCRLVRVYILCLFVRLAQCFRTLELSVSISSRAKSSLEASALGKKDGADIKFLPIFPLRKIPRLPSETLTLNLYEERYIELALSVLQSKNRIFGAMYCSGMPQMVRDGTEEIVPMVPVDSVGVIFELQSHLDEYIPTRDGSMRRRIRLVGQGSVRFIVRDVVSNGYSRRIQSDGVSRNNSSSNKGLSFIVVTADLYRDASTSSSALLPLLTSQDEMMLLQSDYETSQYAVSVTEMQSFVRLSEKLPHTATMQRLEALATTSTKTRLEILNIRDSSSSL